MKTITHCLLFISMVSGMLSCKINYTKISSFNHSNFSDSIDFSKGYQLYVRKINKVGGQNKLVNDEHRKAPKNQFLVELEYLLYSETNHKALFFTYLPSFYYDDNVNDKTGKYAKLQNDSAINIDNIRRVLILDDVRNSNTLVMSEKNKPRNKFYVLEQEPDGSTKRFLFKRSTEKTVPLYRFYYQKNEHQFQIISAENSANNYQTGTIHIDESIATGLSFQKRDAFTLYQNSSLDSLILNDTLQQITLRKQLPSTIDSRTAADIKITEKPSKKQLRKQQYIQSNTLSNIVYKRNGKTEIIFKKELPSNYYYFLFRKKRTNWY